MPLGFLRIFQRDSLNKSMFSVNCKLVQEFVFCCDDLRILLSVVLRLFFLGFSRRYSCEYVESYG